MVINDCLSIHRQFQFHLAMKSNVNEVFLIRYVKTISAKVGKKIMEFNQMIMISIVSNITSSYFMREKSGQYLKSCKS